MPEGTEDDRRIPDDAAALVISTGDEGGVSLTLLFPEGTTGAGLVTGEASEATRICAWAMGEVFEMLGGEVGGG